MVEYVRSDLRPPLKEGIPRPLQEGLSLSWTAARVAGSAIRLYLAGVATKGAPAPYLLLV